MTRNRDPSGIYPGYGAIFMSNRDTKEECLRLKLFGLPLAQAKFVRHVKYGMFLFLFEYQSRELHGVFQATSDGEMDIVPHAYSNSGMKFPAQVKFKTIWKCTPLPETLFSGAISDNYFAPCKFNFGLSKRQVQNLLDLFSRRKLVPHPRVGQVPEGNIRRSAPNLDEPEGAIDEGNSNLGIERYGRNVAPGSGSVPSFEHSQNPISYNRRATGVYGSPSIRNDYGCNDDNSVRLNSNEYERDFASNVGVPVSDDWHLARGDLGNGTYADNKPGDRSWNCEPNVTTARRASSTGYDLLLNEKPGVSLSNPPMYESMLNHATNPLGDDSTLPCSVSNVETLPRSVSHGSYLASYSETVGTNTHPYNPDAPSLDISPSYVSRDTRSLLQSSPRPSSAYPSHQNQLLPPNREVRQDNSLRNAHSSFHFDVPTDNNESNRFSMLYRQNAHTEDDVLGDINFPRPALSPPLRYGNQGIHIAKNRFMLPVNTPSFSSQYGTHEVSRNDIRNLEGTGIWTRTTNYVSNSLVDLYGGQDSERPALSSPRQYGNQGIHIAKSRSMLPVNTPSVSSQYGTYEVSRNDIRNLEGTGTGTRTANYVSNSLVDLYGNQGSERPALSSPPQYGNQGIHIADQNRSMPPVNTPSFSSHGQSRTSVEGIPQYGTYEVSRNDIRNSEETGTGTRTAKYVSNSVLDLYGGQGSERMYSNQVNPRGSVFERLVKPIEVSEDSSTDSKGDDEYAFSSVSEIMASVGQVGYPWVDDEPVEFQAPKRKDTGPSGKKRRIPMASKLAEVASEMNTNDAIITEESDSLLKKKAPFYDFKRRSSKLPKARVEANSTDQSTASAETSSAATELQHKRRKLIRPKFDDEHGGDIISEKMNKEECNDP